MSQLATFFKGSDTRLGVFYPEHYVIAIFADIERARRARWDLCGAGFSSDEVLAASGSDLVELVREESARSGLSGYLMKELSRFLHTEAVYTDRDLMYAEQGAGILAVHCPSERSKNSAWSVIGPEDPLTARYYAAGGIEHLVGEF